MTRTFFSYCRSWHGSIRLLTISCQASREIVRPFPAAGTPAFVAMPCALLRLANPRLHLVNRLPQHPRRLLKRCKPLFRRSAYQLNVLPRPTAVHHGRH